MSGNFNDWRELATEQADESRVWIDDVLLQDLGIDVELSTHEPVAPSLRNQSITIPGMAGAHDMGGTLGTREFTLNIVTPRQSYTDLKEQSRNITSLFYDEWGAPKTIKLRMGDEPNKFYRARVVDEINVRRRSQRGYISVDLTAFDPYAYSVVDHDDVRWGSEVITFRSTEYTFGHESSGGTGGIITEPTTETVTVIGYAVKPTFYIDGSADGLTIEANGYKIELPAFNDASWAINCERYTVTKDGENAFGDVLLGEFWLRKGDNVVSIDGINIDIEMRISFRDKWI